MFRLPITKGPRIFMDSSFCAVDSDREKPE
jgi:hypothetical protein